MKLVVANWKMNKGYSEAKRFAAKIKLVKTNSQIVICPPYTALGILSNELKGTRILLGAQNIHYEDKGAFTGEISASMVKELGCKYVIVGHSERRNYFSESDGIINLKVKAAQRHGLVPILCVGENLSQRQKGETLDVVGKQVTECLKDASSSIVIAYEPVWAIGTGKNATPEQAVEVHLAIKQQLREIFKKDIPVLYGGSVSPATVHQFLREKSIDGVLVGGASLEFETFSKLLA